MWDLGDGTALGVTVLGLILVENCKRGEGGKRKK